MTEPRSRIAQAAELLKGDRLQEAKALAVVELHEHPEDINAKHLLGVIALHEQSFAEAEQILAEVVALRPDLALAHYNRGTALLKLGRIADALANLDAAIDRNPRLAEALVNRGIALRRLGKTEEALASYNDAIALKPRLFDALLARGNALLALRRWREAERSLNQAIEVQPNSALAWNSRGVVLAALKRDLEALSNFERALALSPGSIEVLRNRAPARRYVKRWAEARADYLELLKADTQRKAVQLNLVITELGLCEWNRYLELKPQIADLVLDPESSCEPWNAVLLLETPAAQIAHAERCVAEEYPQSRATVKPYRHDKLRVAYVCSEYWNHPTAYLIAGLFEAHDRNRFEISAVSCGLKEPDEMRRRIEAGVDHFLAVGDLDDAQIAEQMRAREIDIAVDLNGHTGSARLGVFALGAAPLQVTYLGFPGTSGARFFDYVLADPYVIPFAEERFYTERVVWLPESYQPNDSKRVVDPRVPTRAKLGLPEAGFVFCCFNGVYKITPALFDIWMRLLARTKDSVLWLMESCPEAADNLRREAKARDIDPERLVFAGHLPIAQHLARIACADLILDTLPCNAHTTASDALWRGVPIVTCTGTTFAGRVASSLLHAHDLPELITTTLWDYERLARELSEDRDRLAALRKKMRDLKLRVSLFDTNRTARHIEAAYKLMQERLLSGEAPASFAVPALPKSA